MKQRVAYHWLIVFVAVFHQLPLIYVGPVAAATDFLHAPSEPEEASVDTVIKRFHSWPKTTKTIFSRITSFRKFWLKTFSFLLSHLYAFQGS